MAEITRVPIQPIAKGSLMKFWLGVLVGVALSAAAAFVITHKPGLSINTITAGEGPNPTAEDVVFVEYVGTLADGTEFDRSQPMPFDVGDLLPRGTPMDPNGVIPGFRDGLLQMQKGGTYELFIPAEQAYGANPPPGAPQGDLTFQVEVIDILSREETEQRFQAVQAEMMRQMSEGGVEGLELPPE